MNNYLHEFLHVEKNTVNTNYTGWKVLNEVQRSQSFDPYFLPLYNTGPIFKFRQCHDGLNNLIMFCRRKVLLEKGSINRV